MPRDKTTVRDLSVDGSLPAALSGQYSCVAGDGMVHAVTIRTGRVASYRNCSLTELAITSLVAFGGSILAFDGALAYEVSADFDSIRPVDLAGARRSLTSPPRVDPITGELHVLASAVGTGQLYVRVSRGGLTRTIRSIDNAPDRIRQVELTRDHVVLLTDGHVGVTDRNGVNANATWFAVDANACHIAVADDDGETVVVHAIGPSLVRWTLRRRAGTLHFEVLDATPHASASSNPASSRFLWTVGAGAAHKHDLRMGTHESREAGGRNPGALIFVADPDRTRDEDGGWLVGFVHDETENVADFVVLDAQAIGRPAVAVMQIPRRVPTSAHGTWIPAARRNRRGRSREARGAP